MALPLHTVTNSKSLMSQTLLLQFHYPFLIATGKQLERVIIRLSFDQLAHIIYGISILTKLIKAVAIMPQLLDVQFSQCGFLVATFSSAFIFFLAHDY